MNVEEITALQPYKYDNRILAQWQDDGVSISFCAESNRYRLNKGDYVTAIVDWKDSTDLSKSLEVSCRLDFKNGEFTIVQDWWAARYFDAKAKDADTIHAIEVLKRVIDEEAPPVAAAHKIRVVMERLRQGLVRHPSASGNVVSVNTDKGIEELTAMVDSFTVQYPFVDLDLQISTEQPNATGIKL